ncbi:MAG: MEKHLA domain-containing protein [Cyanobacteria bacterium J06600_6]
MTSNSQPDTMQSSSLPVPRQPAIIRWSQILADSYRQALKRDLICTDTPEQLSEALFHAPFVLVSHGTQADPIFNYANQTASQLWGLDWDEFIKTPSAQSAEPVAREERSIMLKQAREQGYIDNYQGIRVTTKGKRFLIQQGIIWNLQDEKGDRCGQAATFSSWEWL